MQSKVVKVAELQAVFTEKVFNLDLVFNLLLQPISLLLVGRLNISE